MQNEATNSAAGKNPYTNSQTGGQFSSTVVLPAPETTPAASPVRARGVRPIAAAVAILGTLTLGGGAVFAGSRIARAANSASDEAHIAQGVRIAGVPVGGLTATQAREKLREWANKQTAQAVTLAAPVSGRKWNFTLADVGGRFDLDTPIVQALKLGKDETLWERVVRGEQPRTENLQPSFKLNESALDKRLAVVGKAIYHAPVNARAKVTDDGQILLAEHEQKGISLDATATKAALLKGGPEALRNGGKADLVVKEEAPQVTAGDLGKMNTQLAAFSTDYGSSSDNRRRNIELATSHINGTILAPGEVFSYNKVVGPRDHRDGFRDAPTYQDGQVVPGPGGGVCQTSTTLYNAVLRANLKIVSRSHHSMPVHYVPVGCDATVAYGSIDFQFQNTTPGPLLVMGKTRNGVLSYNLFGQAPEKKQQVRIESGRHYGNSTGGISVTTYRVVKDETGAETRESLGTSDYRPFGARRN